MDEDPGVFYRYARSKSLTKHDIGPLRDKQNKIRTSQVNIAEILADQYASICTTPFQNLNDPKFLEILNEEPDSTTLDDIYIDREYIRKCLRIELP